RDQGNDVVEGSATGYGDFKFSGITDIVIDSGNGNDLVCYTLVNDLQPGIVRRVNVDLRDGNDIFAGALHAPLQPRRFLPGSELLMKVVGEQGDDQLLLDAMGVTMDHATMKIGFYGGLGNDKISMDYSGFVDHGGISLFAFGDEGS